MCPFVDGNVKCVVYCLQIDEDFKLNFDPDKPIIAKNTIGDGGSTAL